MKELFRKFAHKTSEMAGTSWAFIAAVLVIVAWAAVGPVFHYSDTWQLVINTSTTIITFLMVFLIQNTQNRDGAALQAKLDELIRSNQEARNAYMGIEKLPEEELTQLRENCADEKLVAAPAAS